VGALAMLEEAESVEVRGPLPRVRPAAALKVRIWTAQGRLAEALDWVRERGLSATDDLSYAREFEHLTMARVLLARGGSARGGDGDLEDALQLLARLEAAAEQGGRTATVIETLVLRAVAQQARGDIPGALDALRRALTLGEPEGYLSVFVDAGDRMRELLGDAAALGVGGEYARRLLAAFDARGAAVAAAATRVGSGLAGAAPVGVRVPAVGPASLVPSPPQSSAQSLTPRELEILGLIASGLRNQQIARRLFISPATVKRHVANVYLKLGVGHRTEALVRAKEQGLL
jgi:LuxR family maltose regulon positive regulatory protein